MKNFEDKIVVITGAGSGMGRAYAIEFAKLGSKLALNDFDVETLAETVSLVKDVAPVDVYSEAFDVSDRKQMEAFATNVKNDLGNAHVIINNAGIEGCAKPAYHASIEEFEKIMQVNFYGVLYGTKAFLSQLVENNEGAVVNVSSVFGLVGIPNNADYCAAKFAVRGFTESLQVEFQESPISIHCVHPGGIASNISKTESGKEFAKKYLTTPPEKIAKHVIRCIKSGQPKIVYGRDSLKIWWGANLLPQTLLNGVIWSELKRVMDISEYGDFIKKR